ncbi:MAG: cytochrome c [Thermoanaerobaculia bacterium]
MNRTASRTMLLLGLVVLWSALPAFAVDGKEVFLAQKCNTCHSISTQGIEATTKSEKMKGPDLVDVVQAHEKSWIADFLHKKVDLEGKKHAKEFKGTDEELNALIDWLWAQTKG